jgi:hypothetical protein
LSHVWPPAHSRQRPSGLSHRLPGICRSDPVGRTSGSALGTSRRTAPGRRQSTPTPRPSRSARSFSHRSKAPRWPSRRRRHSDRAARDQRRADDQVGAGGGVCQPQLEPRAHSIQVRALSCEGLAALVEGSTREIPTPERRRLHRKEGDFVRWGRRGGSKSFGE